MTLRVCFLISDLRDGGAQKQCALLANELKKREGVETTFVYFHDGVNSDLLDRSGLSAIKQPVASNYDPRNILRLRRRLTELRPHILLTWTHSCDVYGFFLRGAWPQMRWIMTERDSFYPLDLRYILRRALGRYADAIVANSQKGASYWQAAGAKGPLFVTSNIVVRSSTPRGAGAASSNRIVTIGRLEPQKNVKTVVQAFCLLAERRPDLNFAVLGDGAERLELQTLAEKSGAGDRIAFLGYRKDVADQIAASRLVVSMSHHEGLPNVMLESVAANRLVVPSDIPEHRELLGDDYPFYVLDRTNRECVAAAIEAALSSEREIDMLAPARSRIEAMTPGAVGDAYLRVFSAVSGALAC